MPMPQSPPLRPVPIGYIREMVDHPLPASRLDVEPKDAGIAGAKMAIEENNAGGRFLGDFYSLDVSTVASPEEAVDAMQKLYDSGHRYFVVDASGRHAAQALRLGQGQGRSSLQRPRHRRLAPAGKLPRQRHACRARPLHAG